MAGAKVNIASNWRELREEQRQELRQAYVRVLAKHLRQRKVEKIRHLIVK